MLHEGTATPEPRAVGRKGGRSFAVLAVASICLAAVVVAVVWIFDRGESSDSLSTARHSGLPTSDFHSATVWRRDGGDGHPDLTFTWTLPALFQHFRASNVIL